MAEKPASDGAPPRRVALLVEYDGTRFHGLQRQAHTALTIQGEIERVVKTLGCSEPRFVASGRTDAGVHALGQVIAIDLPERPALNRVAHAMNSLLPRDIRIREAAIAPEGFSPRLDARMRTYVYRLSSREQVPPIQRNFVSYSAYRLSANRTQAAAEAFRGQWEFREWRSTNCQAKRTFLTITETVAIPPERAADVADEPRAYWRFVFRARSFLHNQVRFMVGAIVAVGSGRLELNELKRALVEGRRPQIVKCEDPCGLCLTHVEFAEGRNPFAEKNEEPTSTDV